MRHLDRCPSAAKLEKPRARPWRLSVSGCCLRGGFTEDNPFGNTSINSDASLGCPRVCGYLRGLAGPHPAVRHVHSPLCQIRDGGDPATAFVPCTSRRPLSVARRPLQPWTYATAAGYKGYVTSREGVFIQKRRTCDAVAQTICRDKGIAYATVNCGRFEDNPVPHNGVHRSFHFYACFTREQTRDSCETGAGGIRGEYLCFEQEMEEQKGSVQCTCWQRQAVTATNNNDDLLAYRRQMYTNRVQTPADNVTVYLDRDQHYSTSPTGVNVEVFVAGP